MVLTLLLALCLPIHAQTDPDTLFLEGQRARQAENYERAIQFWRRGQELHPQDARFPRALAELYFDQRLYNLAVHAYEQAVALAPQDEELALKLAETYGLTNQDAKAARFLEEVLPRFKNNWDLILGLAWFLFKTEELQRGIALVLEATDRLGTNASAEMTLGTLYASFYDHERSREHYLRSISLGETSRSRIFLSIAWYNLSILENTFLRHEEALEAIHKSLEYAPRASSHLAMGEMYERRGEWEQARQHYEQAARLDDTPLAQINLARLYLAVGDPESATSALEAAERHPDRSWIFNFGLREEDWERDLAELWAEVHDQRLSLHDLRPRFWPWEWLAWSWERAHLLVQAWLARERWRNLAWRSVDYSRSRGNVPVLLWRSYQSFHGYEGVQRKYLALNREWELARIPQAKRIYDLREAVLNKDPEALRRALAQMDPRWDFSLMQEGLSFLARAGDIEAKEELWRRNPGYLLVKAGPQPAIWETTNFEPPWWVTWWATGLGWKGEEERLPRLRLTKASGRLWWSLSTTSRAGIVDPFPTDAEPWLDLLRQTHRSLRAFSEPSP